MFEDILTNRLLQSANLSNGHEQLIKATVPKFRYSSVQDQLKKTFC